MRRFIAAATIIFLLCVLPNVYAIQKRAVTAQEKQQTVQQTTTVSEAYDVKLPDLTVKIELTVSQQNYPEKGTCDNVRGNFTVTNIGKAPSGEYWFELWYKTPERDWYVFHSDPLPSLMPGQSRTESCESVLRRCPDDEVSVGFKVTVDSRNAIKESNEDNNTDEKLFPTFGQLKEKPHKAIQPFQLQ